MAVSQGLFIVLMKWILTGHTSLSSGNKRCPVRKWKRLLLELGKSWKWNWRNCFNFPEKSSRKWKRGLVELARTGGGNGEFVAILLQFTVPPKNHVSWAVLRPHADTPSTPTARLILFELCVKICSSQSQTTKPQWCKVVWHYAARLLDKVEVHVM